MPRFVQRPRVRVVFTVLGLLLGGFAALAPYSGGG